jgi:hypothetical protein
MSMTLEDHAAGEAQFEPTTSGGPLNDTARALLDRKHGHQLYLPSPVHLDLVIKSAP